MSDELSGYYDPYPYPPLSAPLCVIGMAGSEAHTVAYQLASMTGQSLIELDARVAHQAGCSLASLYEQRGPGAWRALELRELKRALTSGRPSLISLGDGALLSQEARLLRQKHARLIYIERPLSELYTRLKTLITQDPARYPYWSQREPQGEEALAPLLSARLGAYQEAEVRYEAGAQSPLEVARALKAQLQL